MRFSASRSPVVWPAMNAVNQALNETESSVRCIELITEAYASALDRCRERPLGGGPGGGRNR